MRHSHHLRTGFGEFPRIIVHIRLSIHATQDVLSSPACRGCPVRSRRYEHGCRHIRFRRSRHRRAFDSPSRHHHVALHIHPAAGVRQEQLRDPHGLALRQGQRLESRRGTGPADQRFGPLRTPADRWQAGQHKLQRGLFPSRGSPVGSRFFADFRRTVFERRVQLVLPARLQGRSHLDRFSLRQIVGARLYHRCDLPGRRPDGEAAADRFRPVERRRHLCGRYPVQSRSRRVSSRYNRVGYSVQPVGGAVAEGSGVLPRLAGSTATGVSVRVTDEVGAPLRMGHLFARDRLREEHWWGVLDPDECGIRTDCRENHARLGPGRDGDPARLPVRQGRARARLTRTPRRTPGPAGRWHRRC
ncbi:putative fimbrial protein [Pseudomonas aeruginosa]|nr:putative fimbrial protein [Pseudomonas aeruginosa]